MIEFVVDANLPYYFSLWNSGRFIHVKDLNDEWTDGEIWDYATKNNLTIITKDSDFSSRIIIKECSSQSDSLTHWQYENKGIARFSEQKPAYYRRIIERK